MALTIRASGVMERYVLKVTMEGVIYHRSELFTKKRRFRFSQIACILMSSANVLSFQVGSEVFSIPTNPGKPKHKQVIDALLRGVERTRGAS